MPHRWSKRDELAALYIYRFGTEGLPYTLESLAAKLGIGIDSFKMRLRNFAAIEGLGGLKNWSRQSETVYEQYRKWSVDQLRSVAFPELAG